MRGLRRAATVLGALMLVGATLWGGRPALAATAVTAHPAAPAAHPGGEARGHAAADSETRLCGKCTPPLVYNNGPVMSAPIVLTAIYWAPSGFTFPASYKTVVDKYLSDVAAASGATDNVYSVATEYSSTSNGTKQQVQYAIQFAGEQDDSQAYPANSCASDPGYTVCVNDPEVQAELQRLGVTPGLDHLYLVFFPPNVETRDGTGASSDADYCGYHTNFASGSSQVLWANEPYPKLNGCGSGQQPNGDPFADAQISTLSHEINETITDPEPLSGWRDSANNENGDECSEDYGDPLGSVDPNNPETTRYNQVINGGRYYTQTEFSNSDFASGPMRGCAQSVKAGPVVGQNTVTVMTADRNLPPDGSTTTPVSVDVVDTGPGLPVANDDLTFTTASLDSNGVCGTLSSTSATTDANGHATVMYTASAANLSCEINVTEGGTGRTSAAQLNQGTPSDPDPTVDLKLPPALTAGGPAETFSGSVGNPGGSPITNSRIDVALTGDNDAAHGVDASQVHLQYQDAATHGQFLDVPLDGTTQDDGEIDGFIPPETGSSFAPGSSVGLTFRISIASGAASTDLNKSPLSMSLFVDRVDAADGSLVDLADATATTPVHAPPHGYWLVASDGGIFPFGGAGGYGSTGNIKLNKPIVGMAATPSGRGYWLVASDGGIFPFGDAGGFGSTGGIHLNQPIVGMAATPSGKGYWLVASDGGIFPFGDAAGFGSTGNIHLNKPIVGMAATPDGSGYWLVASDGGIFPFGPGAAGFGSTGGMHLNQPIVGMAAAPDGQGYWLVATDGGIFPFGPAAPGFGSTGAIHLNQPIVGMAATGDGLGYWLVAADGGIFPFGDAPGFGSTGNIQLNKPMVGMSGF